MPIKIKDSRGFTLVEIITVMAIIAILAAVAMTNYFSSKRMAEKNICIANLNKIQTIVNTWAIDTGAGAGAAVTMTNLVPNYIKVWPKEGTADYSVPENINTLPVCPNVGTKPDHTL